jgi:hypothetical protein
MTLFERARPFMAVHFAGCAGMGVWFGAVVASGGSPITPETYGPLVYQIDAEFWIACQVIFGGLAAWFAATGHRIRAALFSSLGALLLTGFAVLAWGQPQGTLLLAGAVMWAAPVSAFYSLAAWFGGEIDR